MGMAINAHYLSIYAIKDIKKVYFLVENFKDQIDINLQDEKGKTVLMQAMDNAADMELACFLVDQFKDKININLKDNDGNSALFYANYEMKMTKLFVRKF